MPVVVDDAWLARVHAEVPELPLARRARYVGVYGLEEKDAASLVEDRDPCHFFEACVAELGGTVECGELGAREEARGLVLPTALFARWSR